jgi:hypothetical protein
LSWLVSQALSPPRFFLWFGLVLVG